MLTVGQTSFILFEVPSNLLLKQFSPHVWQSRIFFMWGIITACQAASQNRHQLYAMRFLLGMFEAGMFPGVMAQLSSWYRTDEMGKPVTWLYTLVNLSGIVGALRCYGISYITGSRVSAPGDGSTFSKASRLSCLLASSSGGCQTTPSLLAPGASCLSESKSLSRLGSQRTHPSPAILTFRARRLWLPFAAL